MRPRFICDAMLGKLARGLRILGYDTVFKQDIDNSELIRLGVAEDRIILTKDTLLLRELKDVPHLKMTGDNWEDQLIQVIVNFDLNTSKIFGRCLECGGEIRLVQKTTLERKIPPYIFQKHKKFRQCSVCGKFYWGGSHLKNMRLTFNRLMVKVSGEKRKGIP